MLSPTFDTKQFLHNTIWWSKPLCGENCKIWAVSKSLQNSSCFCSKFLLHFAAKLFCRPRPRWHCSCNTRGAGEKFAHSCAHTVTVLYTHCGVKKHKADWFKRLKKVYLLVQIDMWCLLFSCDKSQKKGHFSLKLASSCNALQQWNAVQHSGE